MKLKDLAKSIKSWNFVEASLGLAAINAFYNSNQPRENLVLEKIKHPFVSIIDQDDRVAVVDAVLENKETGEQYAHLNTHLDHIGFIARLKSAELIRQKAAEFDIPVVVTGDFNFKEGSYVYNKMTESLLSDSKFLAEDSMDSITYHDYNPSSSLSKTIDFIFVNEKADPVTYRVITDKPDGYFVSDHYPIYADLILK